jgi:hypothetical protein
LKAVLKADLDLDPTKSLIEKVEAEMESRQWTKVIPPSDYLSMRMNFDKRFWKLDDREVPSKDYLEKKLEQMESGEWAAEALTEVVSKEDVAPDALQPVWDKTGQLTIKKGSNTVAMPNNPEELRRRLSVLCHGLIMISLRHTNRYELQGITPGLFEKYKTYILGEHVLGLQAKDMVGESVAKPPWHLVMSYEHAIRKAATKIVNESGCTIAFADALTQAWNDPTVKERNFTTPLALVLHRGTSRPVNLNQNQNSSYHDSQTGWKDRKGQKGGGKNKTIKGNGKGGGKRSSKTPDGKAICYRYNNQKEKCRSKRCNFEHVCNRCFGKHPQYNCHSGGPAPDTISN